jgi:ClpP class serine protease
MFSFFKKKIVVPHVRLTGVIGAAGRFKQGMDLAGQRAILKKAFSFKKIKHVAISINSPWRISGSVSFNLQLYKTTSKREKS